MAKRFTDSEKFTDRWFRGLPPLLKLGWDYLYHTCDASGVIDLDEEYGDFVIGEQVDWEALLEAAGDRIQILDNGKWWIKRFIQFQYGKLSTDCKPHIPVISLLEKHGIELLDVPQAGQFKGGAVTEKMKRDLFKRDENTCCYCGEYFDSFDLVADHVTPKSKGGRDKLDNLVASCIQCNSAKSDTGVEVFVSSLQYPEDVIERLRKRLPQRVFDTLKVKEKDKDKEKDKEKDRGSAEGEVHRIESEPLRKSAEDWLAYKRERRESYKPTGLKSFVSRVLTLAEEHGEPAVCSAIQRGMSNGWKGFEHDIGARGSPVASTPVRKPFDLEAWAKQDDQK